MSATVVVKCPRCFCHDNYSICPICDYKFPVDTEHMKEALALCYNSRGGGGNSNIKKVEVLVVSIGV